MSLIENEQAKLSATYLNGIGIALAAVGGIAPWVTFLLQSSTSGVLLVAGIEQQFVFAYPSPYIWSARNVLDAAERMMSAGWKSIAMLLAPLLMFGAALAVYFLTNPRRAATRPPGGVSPRR